MSRIASLAVCMMLAAAFMAGSAVLASAADAAKATVVGVVDVQVILRDATSMKSIQKQVEQKRSQFQGEISAQEKRLRDQEQELKRQQSVLAADAFEAKRRDFEAQVASVQRDVQERRRVLDQAYGEGLRVVQRELTAVIAGIAKERGYNLVVPLGQTLFSDASMALTEEALKRLNKKLPDVALDFATKQKKK
jgi:Skp family chaperone for outer membrane proteins